MTRFSETLKPNYARHLYIPIWMRKEIGMSSESPVHVEIDKNTKKLIITEAPKEEDTK